MINISLVSPQFHYETQYFIHCDLKEHYCELILPDDENYRRNHYVEFSILYGMTLAILSGNIDQDLNMIIRLVADNDFYSQRQNVNDDNVTCY